MEVAFEKIETSPKVKKRKSRLGWAVVLGIMVPVVIWRMNAPVKGTIKKSETGSQKLEEKKWLDYQAKSIYFEYPDKYRVEKIGEATVDTPDNIQLLGGEGVTSGIVVTVKNGVTNFDEISGVTMRRIKTENYREEEIEGGILFRGKEPFELTAVYLKEGKSLTISLTANTNDGRGYEEEFGRILKSVRW